MFKASEPRPIQNLVKQCLKKGAWAIDVNTGSLGKIPEKGMAFFIEAVQSVTDLPLLIDTSNPAAMRAGVSKERIIIDPVGTATGMGRRDYTGKSCFEL